MRKFVSEAGLNYDQEQELTRRLQEEETQRQALFDQVRAGSKSPRDLRQDMRTLRNQADEAMAKVLSEDQKAKCDELIGRQVWRGSNEQILGGNRWGRKPGIGVPGAMSGGRGMSLMVEKSRQRLEELNRRLQSKDLLGASFFAQLAAQGVVLERSVLVSVVPDGDQTYFGTLIRQDGRVLRFDVDLQYPEYSRWEDVTDEARRERQSLRGTKPWADIVIAFDLLETLERG